MGLSGVLDSHRVVVCVGCGGVGKTTTAASLAMHAAMQGKRVLCLTIDPARRLANSLGLDEMTTEEQDVPAALFEALDDAALAAGGVGAAAAAAAADACAFAYATAYCTVSAMSRE